MEITERIKEIVMETQSPVSINVDGLRFHVGRTYHEGDTNCKFYVSGTDIYGERAERMFLEAIKKESE